MAQFRYKLFVVAFFLYFAHAGLLAYFTGDDLMNIQHMHGYFTRPFWRIVLDVMNPLTTSYRPLGGLFYRTLYAIAGFHPLPFRCVCFALLMVNLLLAYRLLRILSESETAAVLGTLVLSYHAAMQGLYFNSGTIYDILCFTFITLAVTIYVTRGPLLLLLLADLLALQSKEMAWTLPVLLVLYELLGRRQRLFAPVAAVSVLTLASACSRLLSSTGLTSSPLYHPTLSAGFFLENCARYWGILFYVPGRFPAAGMLAMWIAMALIAALLRSRALAFGLLFWIVAVIPVAIIPGRDGFVLYLPFLGLALYAGVVLSRLHVPPVLLFFFTAAGLAIAHTHAGNPSLGNPAPDNTIRKLAIELRRTHPTLMPKAQVLFVEDPFEDDWILGFLFCLLYNDPGIAVDRAVSHPHARAYQYVFRYAAGKLEDLPPRTAPCTPQALSAGLADDSSPILCWAGDWLSERFPQAIEGGLTHTNESGATVTIIFTGATLEYICTKAFNRGFAELTIDGASRGILDLYAATPVWQFPFRYDGLTPGPHTAVLRVLGRHNPAATDSTVDVDAFRVQ